MVAGSLLGGCEDVVRVDLEQGIERLVVEGRIEKIHEAPSGYQRINLSTTGEFFSPTQTPRVSGALVEVFDEGGNRYVFQESDSVAGRYETVDLPALTGETYRLRIEWDDEVYVAEQTLLPVPRIDSLYQAFIESNAFDEGGIRAIIDYTDPAGVENYYFWEQTRDGLLFYELNPGTRWTVLGSDEFYDGQRVLGKVPNDEIIYEPGQIAEMRQIALSKEGYEYYFLLFTQAGGGGLFSTPPATLRGNVENVTSPERYPLGYFEASEVSVRQIIIE